MATLIYKIPPTLPFPKGGIIPLFGNPFPVLRQAKRGEGRFSKLCLSDYPILNIFLNSSLLTLDLPFSSSGAFPSLEERQRNRCEEETSLQ